MVLCESIPAAELMVKGFLKLLCCWDGGVEGLMACSTLHMALVLIA